MFCIISKELMVFCEISFVSLSSCYIIDSYVIFDLITVLYMCLTLLNETFHVNAINFVNANVWLIILSWSFSIWGSQFNFVSICIQQSFHSIILMIFTLSECRSISSYTKFTILIANMQNCDLLSNIVVFCDDQLYE